jgi:predicted HD phosphohydrolase
MDDAGSSPKMPHSEDRAKFHAMTEGTADDWMKIGKALGMYSAELPERTLTHLKMLSGDCGGFAVDRLEHCLQTATRAFQAGKDEEYVVCALLHDIGDVLAPRNHAEIASAILKPYVSEANHWMVDKHQIFQSYYYGHLFGGDRNRRDAFKGHESYEYTAQFCHLYDQNSFDPAFKSMPLEAFEPMVHRVLTRPRMTPAARQAEAEDKKATA